ncbi:hypothetical protein HU200_056182 [Digitaria exilis]|uniref:RNA-dependent RNA polymerase n=1 Tax=Digitaria exilis TaxID=1010633 RepID=A0A835E437_9POAL|nr:hypothetical protein HU200_056182 [Digitaria exilis]
MVSPPEPQPPVASHVSVGGFDPRLSACGLADYLESVAGRVLRCRVKFSSAPPGTFPDFQRRPFAASADASRRRRAPDAFRAPRGPVVPLHAFVKKQEVPVVLRDMELNVHQEPGFGQPRDDLFFSVQGEGLMFPVLFLVNVLVHKGIVNDHQLTSDFFGLLKKEKDDVNVAALTELLGEKLQLRNKSAWFFAEDGATTAASIREWMGQFPSNNVAKHAARMGQCFTSSYATVVMRLDEERPHPNEASGSDLDGDVYFVTWDRNLIPPKKESFPPMDYSPAEVKFLPRRALQHVTIFESQYYQISVPLWVSMFAEDIVDFFLKNMINETLGRICNAHVVHADSSNSGAMDAKCIQLAELAATAVDFPKTGKMVAMPASLRPQQYLDFMGKEDDISYKSEKIIGRLYRSIQVYKLGISLEDFTSNNVPYDASLEVPGALHFIADAWQCKCSYESKLNGLLNQYSVHTEAELVTGEIWSLTKRNKKKNDQIKERLKHAYSKLHQEFRKMFETIEVDRCKISDSQKNKLYEMKASAWYQVTYHPEWIQRSRKMIEFDGKEMPARLSFAWIAVDYLTRIKN